MATEQKDKVNGDKPQSYIDKLATETRERLEAIEAETEKLSVQIEDEQKRVDEFVRVSNEKLTELNHEHERLSAMLAELMRA